MKFLALFLTFVCIASASEEQAVDDVQSGPASVEDSSAEEVRGWNPFTRLSRSACVCPNNDYCSCCVDVPFLEDKACLVGRLAQDQIEYNLKISNLVVINKKFPLNGKQESCVQLPKPLDALSSCLTATAIPIAFGTSSCAGIDFRVNGQVAAALVFDCIDIRGGGRLAMGGFLNVNDGARLAFKVKTEYAKVVDDLKNKISLIRSKVANKKW